MKCVAKLAAKTLFVLYFDFACGYIGIGLIVEIPMLLLIFRYQDVLWFVREFLTDHPAT
jgi:hypothetical protein